MSIIQGLIASISNVAAPAATSGIRILELDALTYSGNGDWLDLSGNGGNMYLQNGAVYNSGDHCFDYPPSAISTSLASSYTTLSTMSVAVWIKLIGYPPGGDHTIIGGSTWGLRMDANNSLNFVKYSVTDQTVSGLSFVTGQWYHIVASVDATETRYYVNGNRVATYYESRPMNTPSNQINIGSNNNLNAKVAKAQVYNFPLSDVAVVGLFNSESSDFGLGTLTMPGSVQAVNSYAYFDPKNYTSGDLADLSGHNRTMVLSNNGNSISYSTRNRGTLVSTATDSSDGFRMVGDLTTTNCTVMIASRYNVGATVNGRILASDSNWLLGHWWHAPECFYVDQWVSKSSATTTDQTWRIYTGVCNVSSNNFKFYMNGQLSNTVTVGGHGPLNLSLFKNLAYPGEYSAGTVGIVIVWDRLLNDGEISEIYEYFRCRYGI